MDDRGVSSAVSFAIGIALITGLVAILMFGGSQFVESEQTNARQAQLDQAADRLALAMETAGNSNGDYSKRVNLPTYVQSEQYTIRITDTGTSDRYKVELATDETEVSSYVQTNANLDTPIEIGGQKLVVKYNESTNTITVTDQ